MYLAKVIGHIEAAMRLPGFEDKKLLLLQPIDFHEKPIRWVTIACDCTPGGGAGMNSIVTYVEGREAANPFEGAGKQSIPVDACVTAIVDSWEYKP